MLHAACVHCTVVVKCELLPFEKSVPWHELLPFEKSVPWHELLPFEKSVPWHELLPFEKSVPWNEERTVARRAYRGTNWFRAVPVGPVLSALIKPSTFEPRSWHCKIAKSLLTSTYAFYQLRYSCLQLLLWTQFADMQRYIYAPSPLTVPPWRQLPLPNSVHMTVFSRLPVGFVTDKQTDRLLPRLYQFWGFQ
jgi:hypothetical protein